MIETKTQEVKQASAANKEIAIQKLRETGMSWNDIASAFSDTKERIIESNRNRKKGKSLVDARAVMSKKGILRVNKRYQTKYDLDAGEVEDAIDEEY